MKFKYRKRIVDSQLERKLRVFGGVLVTGPKGCGKTTTCEQKAKTVIKFQSEKNKEELKLIFDINPYQILDYDKPILYDEWQDFKQIWGILREDIDENQRKGAYILTGSSSNFVKVSHTGTTRISTLKMYPMSLYESNDSNGKISIKELFDKPESFKDCHCELKFDDYAYLICRGGWPEIFGITNKTEKIDIAKDIYFQTWNSDVKNANKNCKNPLVTKQILQSYSRNICTLATTQTIYDDVSKLVKRHETIDNYIEALEKLCIIDNIEAWNPNIRSKTAIRSSLKKNLVDPSLAVASLKMNPKSVVQNLRVFGLLFESLCIRDLRIYSGLYSELNYYRDKYGLECDAVLHLEDGRYALIEIKLGGNSIFEGVKNLNKIEELIKKHNNENKVKIELPSFKMVVTAEQKGFKLDKNTFIIPLGCLKD